MAISALWLTCRIVAIENSVAQVVDQHGRKLRLRTDIRRGGGLIPSVGEKWIIDKQHGHWAFASLIKASPPVITGTTDDIPALRNLIDALVEKGIIEDDTVDTQMNARSGHSHV